MASQPSPFPWLAGEPPAPFVLPLLPPASPLTALLGDHSSRGPLLSAPRVGSLAAATGGSSKSLSAPLGSMCVGLVMPSKKSWITCASVTAAASIASSTFIEPCKTRSFTMSR
uniref:Uncharacterized protein n=1 Tax=uncultured marine virus TaxID=186617 RepID=A0A0F7L4R1_9VIRU|nr:hypothetical protein [uncultured marine virus]